jgi:hypothetical protein
VFRGCREEGLIPDAEGPREALEVQLFGIGERSTLTAPAEHLLGREEDGGSLGSKEAAVVQLLVAGEDGIVDREVAGFA